ncbi:hypothetical protein HC891_19920 [Candidatus Gracilibacteria bacterium]|nr:hypothetical protein [Candidatus Gracilibacteria bacterium]
MQPQEDAVTSSDSAAPAPTTLATCLAPPGGRRTVPAPVERRESPPPCSHCRDAGWFVADLPYDLLPSAR